MKRFGAALIPPKGMSDEKKALFSTLRSELLGLYSEKSRAIADRETDRYRYLMQWRSQLAGVLNAVSDQVFKLGDAQVSSVWNNLVKSIKGSIMLTTLEGVDLPGYKIEPLPQQIRELYSTTDPQGKEVFFNVTGVPGILSSIRKLTSDDGGWLYLERFTGTLTPLSFITYLDQFGNIMTGSQSYGTYPWSASDIAGNYMIQNLTPEQRLRAGSIIAGILDSSGFYKTLDLGKKLFEAVVISTLNVGDVLRAIKDVESRIDELVASYHEDSAGTPTELIHTPELPEMTVDEEDVLDEKLQTTPIPKAEVYTPTIAKKSNKGILIAAAVAAGALLLT